MNTPGATSFFNKQQFEKQKKCFKAVVALCQTRGIKLYVVAMPITDDNLKLMPKELYRGYIDCLASTTRDAGIPFLDLQKSRQYNNDDFYDTVHLERLRLANAFFGRHVPDLIVEKQGLAGEALDQGRKSNTPGQRQASDQAAIAGTKRSSSPTY